MQLSKLEIIGFKSFAQKVNLRFGEGITAIVGPNGCGKTNVVDAIRWALGEQKSSTLRSDKMEDVIFNGTRTRKPLGLSEVSLTIENNRGVLPTEYNEVTITRRLFRSGESEYLLNKSVCRLKDIIDLFMDTGMGANAYSVIELKMVETILSDRAEERRRLFEEAAGITKYKARRKEALRKLDQVKDDLTRVDDIIKEVGKKVSSLERQAERAQKYHEISSASKTLELELLEREYSLTSDRITPVATRLDELHADQKKLHTELDAIETLIALFRQEAADIETTLGGVQRDVSDHAERMSRTREEIAVSAEREKSLRSQVVRYEAERNELETRATALTQSLAEAQTRLSSFSSTISDREATHSIALDQKREADASVAASRSTVREARESVIRAIEGIGAMRGESERTQARIETIHGRIARYDEESAMLAAKRIERDNERAISTNDRNVLMGKLTAAETKRHEAVQEQDQLRATLERLQTNSFTFQNELGKKLSAIEFFSGVIEQGTSSGEAAEFLLNDSSWSAERTTVADAVSTDARFRVAIESALGPTLSYFVVPTSADAFRAMDLLKRSEKGKATFVCLDRIPQASATQAAPSTTGVVGWARDLVKAPSPYNGLFDYLFDGVLVIDGIEYATAALEQSHATSCVTLDGEVVTRSGVVRGGSRKISEGSTIGKREQMAALEVETENLRAEVAAIDVEIARKKIELESIDLRAYDEAVRQAERDIANIEKMIAQHEYEISRIADMLAQNARDRHAAGEEISALEHEREGFAPKLGELELAQRVAEEYSQERERILEQAEATLVSAAEEEREANMALVHARSENQNLLSEFERLSQTLISTSELAARRQTEILEAGRELEELAVRQDEFRRLLISLEEDHKVLVERRNEITLKLEHKRDEIDTQQERLRAERRMHDETLGIAHDLEMKLHDLEQTKVMLETRAREEFELPTIDKKAFDDADRYPLEDRREEARQLRQRLKNLGAVNLLAYEEYTEEKKRFDFLTEQRADLSASEITLKQTIEEINTTAQRQFEETFAKIRENFIAIFTSLFNEGDECDLKLEEGVDPLEARVEIIAKPRGKRPHSIELLSGGEKTLTAIALLFAIYLVKPSPFCILDEVDAPLDDANIDRFVNIIRKFAGNTQFIIVTHNKRTMEAADAMYGVTMEEMGVSKLVSVRFVGEKVATAA